MTTTAIDLGTVYIFVQKLITPFTRWPAFQRGIIDAQGNVLKKKSQLMTPEDKAAWGYVDILVTNLKKIIAKVPGGTSQMASITAAALLLREQPELEDLQYIEERFIFLREEAAVNAAGGGQVAAIGVGPAGEPGRKKGKKSKTKDDMPILTRPPLTLKRT